MRQLLACLFLLCSAWVSYVCSQDQQRPLSNDPSDTASPKTTISESKTRSGGTLGLVGADWKKRGFKGVEITNISEGGLAAMAGLHKGDVITEVNGNKIVSTQQLNSVVSRIEPGRHLHILYLLKTQLGWMPKETTAIPKRDLMSASRAMCQGPGEAAVDNESPSVAQKRSISTEQMSASRSIQQAASAAAATRGKYPGDRSELGLGQRRGSKELLQPDSRIGRVQKTGSIDPI